MKRLLLASIAVVGIFAASANAADLSALPARAPSMAPLPNYNWTGCYAGGHYRFSWGHSDNTSFDTVSGAQIGSGSTSSSTSHGGGQLGCDYMMQSRLVVGIVADASSGASNSVTNSNPAGTIAQLDQSKTSVAGTVRGRVGYAVDNTLFYATGGWAWTDATATRTQLLGTTGLATPGTVESVSSSRNGWTLGTGVEYWLARNWSVFGQYRYTDFGSETRAFPVAQRSTTITTTQNSLELGVNYRF